MDIRQLRTFATLAETGSLGKTADRLRVAQPALSRQIRLLEEDIGLPLFNRHSRGMQITEAGKELLVRVSGLIRQLDQALKEVRELKTAVSGAVAIGLIPSVSSILGGRLGQRVATELPLTETSKVIKRQLRAQRWQVDDLVYFRPKNGESLRRLTAADVDAIRTRFAARDRLGELDKV